MRRRKRLLRVGIAAALLVVAVPSAAWAYPLIDDGGQVDAHTEKAGCSLDPRLLKMEPQLCSNASGNDSVRGRVADTARLQGQADAYETQQANQVTADRGTQTFDQPPAPSDSTEIAIGWWMVSIAVAAGGVAGLIVGLRRGRPHALS